MKKTFLYILLLLSFTGIQFSSQARQPVSFFLGADEFRGIEIYDVIQDNQMNYWFATSEGLFIYDFYTFEKVECGGAKSRAFFNLVKDASGNIFCINLNHQVFIIRNRTCRVLYELTREESSPDMHLVATEDDKLLICSGMLLILDKSGAIQLRHSMNGKNAGQPKKLHSGEVIVHTSISDTILVYEKGKFHPEGLQISGRLSGTLQFFEANQSMYAVDMITRQVYTFFRGTNTLAPIASPDWFRSAGNIRLYSAGPYAWIAGTLPGVQWMNAGLKGDPEIWFGRYFISDVFRDAEGNYLLSTFGHGVIVIPHPEEAEVINTFDGDLITSMYSDPFTGLWLGTSRGRLLLMQEGQFTVLSDTGKRSINCVASEKNSPYVVYDDGKIRLREKNTGKTAHLLDASLKDAVFTGPGEIYMATNRGVVRARLSEGGKSDLTWLPDLRMRIYSIEREAQSGAIYASTSEGLWKIPHPEDSLPDADHVSNIYPSFLGIWNEELLASTSDGKLHTFGAEGAGAILSPELNNQPLVLNTFIDHQGSLIAGSARGLFRVAMSENAAFGTFEIRGFSNKRILCMADHKGKIWVSHTDGLQPLTGFSQEGQPPVVRIQNILINDIQADTSRLDFGYDQRKIKFIVSSLTLRHKDGLRYQYKLKDHDGQWNTLEPESHEILFNALAPGTYTLMIRAEAYGQTSPEITRTFRIRQPFYYSFWFLSGGMALLLLAVVAAYRRRLRVQRIRAEQLNMLNASRLAAIQSQMNPHFIFNCLNSIQDLVLKGDQEHAYTYITHFSNLVRTTLSYSQKDFIDFEQEVELLKLYLSLEQLRFRQHLIFDIDIGDVEDIMIPPLIIQPFVENALVHGLLHKEGEKRLKISFRQGETLTCIIEDNGIGREAAHRIRERQRGNHESFSGSAIRNRFEILAGIFGGAFGYTTEDVISDGNPSGTRVTLTIPVKHKY